MLLGYFNEEAYCQLLADIESNAEKYAGDEEWLDEYFGSKNNYWGQSEALEPFSFVPYYDNCSDDKGKSLNDLANTINIYDALKGLTPLQASNKLMWTYLCHAQQEYRKYIKHRWMKNPRPNTIKTRYFVTDTDSLLNGNALSRLWWSAHLTYDKSNENPYWLTEILYTNQTIRTDVMDTLNRSNFNRMKGVLLAIENIKREMGPDDEPLINVFRECKKYLNRYGAVTNLDYVDSETIKDLAYGKMVKILEKNRERRERE